MLDFLCTPAGSSGDLCTVYALHACMHKRVLQVSHKRERDVFVNSCVYTHEFARTAIAI